MQHEKKFLTVSVDGGLISRLDRVARREQFTRSCLVRRLLYQGLAALSKDTAKHCRRGSRAVANSEQAESKNQPARFKGPAVAAAVQKLSNRLAEG
jgi:hypothetical protein